MTELQALRRFKNVVVRKYALTTQCPPIQKCVVCDALRLVKAATKKGK